MALQRTIRCNKCGEEYCYFPDTVLYLRDKCECGCKEFTTTKEENVVFEIKTPYGKMIIDGRSKKIVTDDGDEVPIPPISLSLLFKEKRNA